MSHNYGLISDIDVLTLQKTLDLIMDDFRNQPIHVLEIGIYNGRTSKGIKEYIQSYGRECIYTGIDNLQDQEPRVFFPDDAKLILGDSHIVYTRIPEHSQHLIIFDGNHSYPYVIMDFFCYQDKVKYDGYLMFHDTGSHIKPFKDYQKTGDKSHPDSHISVRKALMDIGLFDFVWMDRDNSDLNGVVVGEWGVIFDEADENDEAGGFTVFKKTSR